MDLALCTGAQSCWNRKGPSPNCSHKVGSMELSNISWYAGAFRVSFTGTKGPSPAPKKQPTPKSSRHQTLHFAQCQPSTVHLAMTKPRLVHQITRCKSTIGHSRELISTSLEFSGGMLYTAASDALHCTCWCMAWIQLLSHRNPFLEALYALFLS